VINQVENVLKLIRPGDRVLDVGGGYGAVGRADAVLDAASYDCYLARKTGDDRVNFSRDTWYVGDICAAAAWRSIADKSFDFVVCSHTLEDVRDPVFVCSQLVRIGKAGYIETPSKFRECAKPSAQAVVAGWEHHRWLLEVENGGLFFRAKNPWIHHFDYLGNARRSYFFDDLKQFLGVHWLASFDYAERAQKGSPIETEDLFYFYDHYPYDEPESCERPPAFHRIDNVRFRGKPLYLGHEYRLPIEDEYSHDQILAMHKARLEAEGRFLYEPPSKLLSFGRRVWHRARRLIP
jgi:ubiquinone/menaquinone biosynthesis C-methylase UbiE